MVPPSWPYTAGYYAAGESHRDIYHRLWNDPNWSAALILEDDAEFTEHFYAGFNEFLEEINNDFPDWLALWLGGWNRTAPKRVGKLVNLQRGCTQMHAYVVNRHGLLRLWDHVWVEQFAVIDQSTASMMGIDECVYSPIEWHAVQGGYGSDTLRCV
jgi:GR25 family glycosyltransferase involved in LPS biosynthesis